MELITRKTFAPIVQDMERVLSSAKVQEEIFFAVQHINKSKKLKECSNSSLLQAVYNISNIHLSLNPASKEAYLIPRYSNGGFEAVLEPSYVGLVKLLTDAGSIKSITCQLVHEGDQFEIDIANNQNPVSHKPCMVKAKKGAIIGAYALATLQDKSRQVEWMDVDDINAIRDRSETYKAFKAKKIDSCTWETDYGEMARKTVIKRIYKYLPRTERLQAIDKAIEIDNTDYTASESQIQYIESLLQSCSLDHEEVANLEMETAIMTPDRASKVIEYLKNNQLGPDHGNLGNQKQTAKHIKTIAG